VRLEAQRAQRRGAGRWGGWRIFYYTRKKVRLLYISSRRIDIVSSGHLKVIAN
jgi:hypothetical protein